MDAERATMVRGAREELAVIQAYARRANKRVRYNTLDWFDKIEARQRRVLLESACVWRTAGPNAAALYLLLGQRARSLEPDVARRRDDQYRDGFCC